MPPDLRTGESALRSAMSEYNKELFEKYGLLFVDTTYKGVTDGGDESFINHLSQYIDINLEQYNTGGNPLCYISSSVNKSEYAGANNHELVANQIVNYMSNIYKDDSSFSDDDLIEKYILLKFGEDVHSENKNTIVIILFHRYIFCFFINCCIYFRPDKVDC